MIAGLADARERTDKPIALINTLTDVADALTDALAERGVIQLSGARVAARAIGHAGRYARWRQGTRPAQVGAAVDTARRTRALALHLPPAGSGGVAESASKDLLRCYDIRCRPAALAEAPMRRSRWSARSATRSR
ncbi:MAG: hypothetical protein U0841_00535 [Chloroflexia bacterium]